MEPFVTHTGRAVPLRRSNVDTDQIIPAVWLKRVSREGFGEGLLLSGLAVVRQSEINVEAQRLRLALHSLEQRFGLPNLVLGERRKCRSQSGGVLKRLQLESCSFRNRLFPRLEVLANAQAVKLSLYAPGRRTLPIFKPTDSKLCVVHA